MWQAVVNAIMNFRKMRRISWLAKQLWCSEKDSAPLPDMRDTVNYKYCFFHSWFPWFFYNYLLSNALCEGVILLFSHTSYFVCLPLLRYSSVARPHWMIKYNYLLS
jgi:hypothetical protein